MCDWNVRNAPTQSRRVLPEIVLTCLLKQINLLRLIMVNPRALFGNPVQVSNVDHWLHGLILAIILRLMWSLSIYLSWEGNLQIELVAKLGSSNDYYICNLRRYDVSHREIIEIIRLRLRLKTWRQLAVKSLSNEAASWLPIVIHCWKIMTSPYII